MTTFEERSRVVTWDDPVASWKAASGLRGIEVLRAIVGGELPPPPVARLLGFEVDKVSEGLEGSSVVVTATPTYKLSRLSYIERRINPYV